MTVMEKNGQKAILISPDVKIADERELLDIFAAARYEHDCASLIVPRESLCDDFFDLKTRVAGEMLQKCSNYRMKFAVVGDFSEIKSKSLRDFIYECNKGSLVFFKPDIDSALNALTS